MENIKKDELQALLDTLKGKEYDKYKIFGQLLETIGSNSNYHNQFTIEVAKWSPYYISVVTNDFYRIVLFNIQIRRQKESCSNKWFIKDIEIDYYNENVERDLEKTKDKIKEEKRQESEAKEVAKKVINFLKEQGYDYWNRRKIINAVIYEDNYSLDQKDE